MSPAIISQPLNMPSTSINIAPNSAQVSSSGTSASTATPTSIPSRRRSSILASNTAVPLIANTTVNPLASFLSNGTFRLPTAVAVAPPSGTSRRTSSGVSNRRISSSSSDAGGSTDALLDLTGSLSSINRRSNLNLSAVAAGSGVSTSGPDGTLGEEGSAAGAPTNTRQWNNLSSVVQSISPLLPSSVLFQRAARRVMGSQNMGRLSGNRRSGPSSGGLTSSNSVDSSTMDRDDLLTLLSAMEEGVSDEPRPGSDTAATTNNTNPSPGPSSNVQPAGGSSATGDTDGCSNAGGGGNEAPVAGVSGGAAAVSTTSKKDAEPLKTLSVSDLNTCDKDNKTDVDSDGGHARPTGAIPKMRQDSACVIDIDENGGDEHKPSNECSDGGSNNRSLFGSLFSSLTGAGAKDDDGSAQQTKTFVNNSTTDSNSKAKNNADASHSVAVDIESVEKLSDANKKDEGASSGSSGGDKTKAITTAGTSGGEGSDSNDGAGDATNNNNNANDSNETNGNEETEENNEEEEETEETTPEDPYWTSVLWQLPVLLGMMLGKYLQYYFFDILAILSVAGLFHIFNMVVKRNVVSNRQITLGWQQCCVKMFQNWKKKLTCRRRRLMTGRWGGVRGALMNNANNAEAGVGEAVGGANGPVGGASDPVGGANDSVGGANGTVGGSNSAGGGANNTSESNAAAAAGPTSISTNNESDKSKTLETSGVATVGATTASSSTAINNVSKAESSSSPKIAASAASTVAATVTSVAPTPSTTSTTTAGSVVEDWWGKFKNLTIGSTSSEAGSTSEASGTPTTTTTSDQTVATITTSPAITTTSSTATATTASTVAAEGAVSSSIEAAAAVGPPGPPPFESEVSLDSVLSLSEEDQQAQESVECVQERAELVLLTFVATPLVAFLFYGGLWKGEELWRSLGFLSPALPPVVLTHVLWLCLAVDYLARLCTVWLKACLCLVLLCRSGASVLSKGKYYPVLEMLSQLYRCLLPVHPWFLYLCNYYDAPDEVSGAPRPHTARTPIGIFDEGPSVGGMDGDFLVTASPVIRERSTPSSYQFWGIALFIVYLLNKKVDVATNAVNLWQAFKALRANTGSYGTAPSKSEIENSGGKCPICHDPFKGPTLLTCSHIFCEGCIVQWFQRERICPMCRAQIADDPLWKDGATSQLPQVI